MSYMFLCLFLTDFFFLNDTLAFSKTAKKRLSKNDFGEEGGIDGNIKAHLYTSGKEIVKLPIRIHDDRDKVFLFIAGKKRTLRWDEKRRSCRCLGYQDEKYKLLLDWSVDEKSPSAILSLRYPFKLKVKNYEATATLNEKWESMDIKIGKESSTFHLREKAKCKKCRIYFADKYKAILWWPSKNKPLKVLIEPLRAKKEKDQ